MLAFALALLHLCALAALGSSAAGTLVSNLVQLGASLLAAGVCLAQARAARGLPRRFFHLAALSLGVWAAGQASFTYYENYLQAPIPSLSLTDVAFLGFYLPLAVLVFLRPWNETQKVDWIRALDLAQVGVVFSAIYLYFFFFLASFLHTRSAMMEWGVNIVYDRLNLGLIGGFLFRVLSRADRPWRGLYSRLAGALTAYALGDTLYRYGVVVWGL